MKKKKIVQIWQRLLGYAIGFSAWLAGLYCFEISPQGTVHLSHCKIWNHLFKVFLWALGISFLFHLPKIYSVLLCNALEGNEIILLILLVFFIYIRLLWPRILLSVLPGFHVFFCPQCYRRQTFKFLPISFRYGFWVTYLCTYCSCLVNGYGEQVFYPLRTPFNKLIAGLVKSVLFVLVAIVLGIACFAISWKKISSL